MSFYTEESYHTGSDSLPLTNAKLADLANGLYRKFYSGATAEVYFNGNYEFNCRVFAMSVGGDDVIRGATKDGNNNRVERIDELDVSPYSSITLDDGKSDVAYMWRNMYGAIQASSSFIKDGLLCTVLPTVLASEFGNDTMRMIRTFDAETYERLVSDGKIVPDTASQLLGEGYFVRALSYFYLVRFFGAVPCYADYTNTVGVNGDAAQNEQLARTPLQDVYEKMIVRDLQLAVAMLPTTSRTGTSDRPSSWAAKACLADVYMHMAGWPLKQTDKYASAATQCLDIIQGAGLTLTPEYKNLWMEATKTQANEHIFAIHHKAIPSDIKNSWASNYGKSYFAADESINGQTGWSDYLMDSAFYESFHADKRKTFIGLTTLQTASGPLSWKLSAQKSPPINKYRDYGGIESPQSNGLTPIYRYAQVLLMYAEASNQTEGGPNAVALQSLQQVQSRSTTNGQPYTLAGLDKDAFDKAVFDELGWEFAIEAKRWFQLVRKEKVVEQNQFNPRVKARLAARGVTTEVAAQSGKGYLFPIPTESIQMASASGVTITQNPGY